MNIAIWKKSITPWTFAAASMVCLPVFAGDIEDIHAVEEARYEAMVAVDPDALAKTLADEFIYHQANGKINDKPGYVKQMMSLTVRIFSYERYDVKVNVYGDIATAAGDTRLDLEIGGERRKADLRYLNVWVKRDGRWQLAKRQSAFKS
jgi:ketosteroid isomerase-like protein